MDGRPTEQKELILLKNIVVRMLSRGPINSVFGRLRSHTVTIFMIHRAHDPRTGLTGTDPEFLEQAIQTLRHREMHITSLRDIFRRAQTGRPQPPYSVAFTMDDGFWDQGEILAPVFVRLKCPATIFLITDFVDGLLWPWDDRLGWVLTHTDKARLAIEIFGNTLNLDLSSPETTSESVGMVRAVFKAAPAEWIEDGLREISRMACVQLSVDPPKEHRAISWETARRLECLGIDFGPHSLTHRIFSRMNDTTAERELTRSWHRLQSELSNPVPIFAWPTGRADDFGSRDVQICKNAGLVGAVATCDDYGDMRTDGDSRFSVRRFAFPSSETDLLQYATWIERAKQILRDLNPG